MNPTTPQPNDDPEIDPAELQEAIDETETSMTSPELNEQTKTLTTWDEPPSATGSTAPKVLPEDETSAAEQLVYEGTDEADRDTRIAAADPDFEP